MCQAEKEKRAAEVDRKLLEVALMLRLGVSWEARAPLARSPTSLWGLKWSHSAQLSREAAMVVECREGPSSSFHEAA